MSEQPREPVLNTGPSGKTILLILLAAAVLFLIGFAIDASARSKDEGIGAILPVLLGLALLLLDFVLLIVFLARRKKLREQ
jgi:uncharacterized Tic20 family protein